MKETREMNDKELFKLISNKTVSNIINTGDKQLKIDEVLPTGSIQLDSALGIGGIPSGKIIEIYGNESSGKTTIALQIIKKTQENNKRCLYIDVENSLNIGYLNNLGIDTSKLLIANPLSGEQTFQIMEIMIENNSVDLIVVDSVAAMLPEIEKESDFDNPQIGALARLMSKGLRKIQSQLMNKNVTIIFINQIREKIGVMFGNPETTTGGKALKFFSSVRMEVRKAELIKEGIEKIGIKSKITIIKNKVAPPLKQAFIDIYFDKGFNEQNEILDFAIEHEVILKSGS